jgi:hypothetical protein
MTAGIVPSNIFKSSHKDQLSIYSMSISIHLPEKMPASQLAHKRTSRQAGKLASLLTSLPYLVNRQYLFAVSDS